MKKMYYAVDGNGFKTFYVGIPKRNVKKKCWVGKMGLILYTDKKNLPDITWDDDPIEVVVNFSFQPTCEWMMSWGKRNVVDISPCPLEMHIKGTEEWNDMLFVFIYNDKDRTEENMEFFNSMIIKTNNIRRTSVFIPRKDKEDWIIEN